MFNGYYETVPNNPYVRAVPISPRQSRAVRVYYQDAPDFEYIPVEREYARIGPTSPRLYYREENLRILSDGSRFHEGDRYLRAASRAEYANSDRYLTSVGPEKKESSQGRNVESLNREENKPMTRDHTIEADAGYRSRSNLPSDMPSKSIPPPGDNGPEAPSSLPSGAPTPAPPQPTSGGQSPSDMGGPRDARLIATDSGYRGRSLVHEPGYTDHIGTPSAMIRGVFADEPYPPSEIFYRSRSSKYGRYEAQRRRLQHERSPSPPHYGHISHPEGEMRYVRDHDVYYEPEPRYVRVGDRARGYSPPVVRRLPGDAYLAEYGRPVEYVRVRDPYSQRYVSGRPGGPELVEYAPSQSYERDLGGAAPGAPVYDDRHYVQTSNSHSRRERNELKSGATTGNDEDDYEPPGTVAPRKA